MWGYCPASMCIVYMYTKLGGQKWNKKLAKNWHQNIVWLTSMCACRTNWGEWSASACHPLSLPLCFQQSKLARLSGMPHLFLGSFLFPVFFFSDQVYWCKAASLWGYWWVRAPSLLHQFPCRQPERPAVGWSKMAAFTAEEFQKSNSKRSDFQIMRRLC